MRRASPEAWLFVGFIICLVVLPVVAGLIVLKVYRKYKPIEVQETNSIAVLHQKTHDSFFTVLVVGWLICSPIFYWLYLWYLS